jgi:hypothetical protein
MKAYDVLPCDTQPRKLAMPEVTLFRYTPTLGEELDKGFIRPEEALRLYRAMLLQRGVEYMVRDLDVKRFVPYPGYQYRGTSHLSVGMEATAVGAMSVLKREDYITSTHRGHGHCLNKGLYALQEMDEAAVRQFLEDAEANEFPLSEYRDLREAANDYHVYRTVAELLGKEACTSPTSAWATWEPTRSWAEAWASPRALPWRWTCWNSSGWWCAAWATGR